VRFAYSLVSPRTEAQLSHSRTKILLHALVAGLAFDLAVPAAEIGRLQGVVTRPVLANARDQGSQMPLIITQAEED
jgi:hypothetical protein